MTEKSPLREAGWYSSGMLDVLPSIDQVVEHLNANPIIERHGLAPSFDGSWWSYDAAWKVDGAQVRGRLSIHVQPGANSKNPVIPDPREYDPETSPLYGQWYVYANADGSSWSASWPSPLQVFLSKRMKVNYAALEYAGCTSLHIHNTRMESIPSLINSVSKLPWLVPVFTSEDQEPWRREETSRVTPLIPRLPASLYGRILEIRVMDEPCREAINRILSRHKAHLPRGGAAIVLPAKRRRGFQVSELTFPMRPPLAQGGDLESISTALTKMLSSGVMEVNSDAMEELRNEWSLLSESEMLSKAADTIERLENEKSELVKALTATQGFAEKFKEHCKKLVEVAKAAEAREEKALENAKEAERDLSQLLQMVENSDLGEAMRAREAAEQEVQAAEELMDEQNQELSSLRRENDQLRRELARFEGALEAAPAEINEVDITSWDDIFDESSSLEYVVLGRLESGVDKLRGQDQEKTWIRWSWRAIQALDEYARMKKERGADAVPHFDLYLQDPLARRAIPKMRYSGSESQGVMSNPRFRNARVLPVEKSVSRDGWVLMESHIRIGSGKPPAPRMHFYDDTNGSTGKIYIGYLGPHLPNYQTN
ncbi:hypothetical protein [Streptomyces cucumeris]|uniref:hypothetical protein n=1 Tax=Streptomyces cucumeris TaxID=2962890 RepID=UPI0020C893F6|nr:hypothetical protein [Streptomyces sp. NEAU-Y11]MCP9209534.1 hypothetical protein [Streptomyces sp. NEAU-Y11]